MDGTRNERLQVTLPEDYYLSNFLEFLNSTSTTNYNCLDPQAKQYIRIFNQLEQQAKLLYARLINRRGNFITRAKIKYPEIYDPEKTIGQLLDSGLISLAGKSSDLQNLAAYLTKSELQQILRQAGYSSRLSGNQKKDETEQLFLECIDHQQLVNSDFSAQVFEKNHRRELAYLQFLQFGRFSSGILNQYTLRDLGIRKTRERTNYRSRFNCFEAAQSEFYFLYHRIEQPEFSAREDLLAQIAQWPEPLTNGATGAREDYLCTLANQRIAHQDHNGAIGILELARGAANIKKLLVLKHKHQTPEAVAECVQRVEAGAGNVLAATYARDFLARKVNNSSNTTYLTKSLRAAPQIVISASYRGQTEKGVIDHFTEKGMVAFKTENRFWITIFFLLFYDELFGEAGPYSSSSFENVPAALSTGEFYAENEQLIKERCQRAADFAFLSEQSEKLYPCPVGLKHLVYRSQEKLLEIAGSFCLAVGQLPEIPDFAPLLAKLAQDFRSAKRGFPDLIVCNADYTGLQFLEVKSTNDYLRAEQSQKINELKAAGFSAGLLRVGWAFEQQQTYAVVDIETTGSFGANRKQRITEVGAYKVVDGEITESFQQLVNPEKHIPRKIQELTGINDQMVADQPVFAEIADELKEFLAGTIFVAHSVNFDYGVIAQEFRDLQISFTLPKLCTVRSMRLAYPGLKSYSLKNLCAQFGIKLVNHHRAAADARATVELLKLVLESGALE